MFLIAVAPAFHLLSIMFPSNFHVPSKDNTSSLRPPISMTDVSKDTVVTKATGAGSSCPNTQALADGYRSSVVFW